jgi:hypothetical protein
MIKIMTNIKQLILTLVALFAMTAGAWADGKVYTSAVDITALQVGDILAEGASITGSGSIIFDNNRVKVNGTLQTDGFCYLYTNDFDSFGAEGVISLKNNTTMSPVDKDNNDGNAWEVTQVSFAENNNRINIQGITYAPAGIEVNGPTIVEGKPQWTFEMPAGNVELQVEYYPGMLIKPTNLVGGTLSVEGLGLGTTSFTAPSEWDHNSTRLTSSHFEGFKSVTEEEAKAWPGVPATGKVALFYNYDETEQKWDMIYFKDGAFDQIHKGQYQQLATIYNLLDFNFSVFYTTGMQMPAGFEKDDDGNIYVKKDTKFTVIAKPAEGYHLVSWSDDAENKELEREFTMTDDDFTVTATFSDEYDLAFEAANANTIEAGKATVKVGDAAATVTEGKLQGVKMGSKVTITAKEGYKFRKVEAKKGGAATLATALENGATVVIAFKYRDDGTCTFTNNNGTFTFVSGTGQLGGGNGPKQLSVENGKLIFKGSGTNSFTDRWSWYGFQVTFDPTANTYEVWKGSDLDVASFTSISVNGTDITDQLSELK